MYHSTAKVTVIGKMYTRFRNDALFLRYASGQTSRHTHHNILYTSSGRYMADRIRIERFVSICDFCVRDFE